LGTPPFCQSCTYALLESQAQLEEGADFLDKAGAAAKRVTGALRELAPSRGGDGGALADSVSDRLESAGERVQEVRASDSTFRLGSGSRHPQQRLAACIL